MSNSIPNLAISGYRSFAAQPQYLPRLAKVNILIGRNNSGKSNLLRFILDMYPKSSEPHELKFSPLDKHLSGRPNTCVGIIVPFELDESGNPIAAQDHPVSQLPHLGHKRDFIRGVIGKILKKKAELDELDQCWHVGTLPGRKDQNPNWQAAIATIQQDALYDAWSTITKRTGGDRQSHWEPEILRAIQPVYTPIAPYLVPATREISPGTDSSDTLGGAGIIERIAQLQNPRLDDLADRRRFINIRDFLRYVTDSNDAEIEVPHDRKTILVHMGGRSLPIERLGTGIHEVVILAAAASVIEDSVVCIEEPELHLNPLLQRKLMRYLVEKTTNQYFIATHSAAVMDTPGAEIYHVRLQSGASIVEHATTDVRRSLVCQDLGYHASDLLQCNSVIWVEGPSDRIHINHWLRIADPGLAEGTHYSIMFYGGRLASHLTFEADEQALRDFVSLRRLNRHSAIVIDSDRDAPGKRLNETKLRLQREFDTDGGLAWITDGREIENYWKADAIRVALAAVVPGATPLTNLDRYDNALTVETRTGRIAQAPKVQMAHALVSLQTTDLSYLDLGRRVARLVQFIRASNPTVRNAA